MLESWEFPVKRSVSPHPLMKNAPIPASADGLAERCFTMCLRQERVDIKGVVREVKAGKEGKIGNVVQGFAYIAAPCTDTATTETCRMRSSRGEVKYIGSGLRMGLNKRSDSMTHGKAFR